MPNEFAPDFDDPAFDTDAWYRRSPEDIRQAKQAADYQAWRNLSPVGMSDDERADWEAQNGGIADDASAAGVDAAAKAPRPLQTVGPGARLILDKIAGAELPDAARHGDPAGYDTPFNYGIGGPPLTKKLTAMTLDEVDAHQAQMQRTQPSSVVGRYQLKRSTLQEARDLYGLKGSNLFSPQMQDNIARTLLQRHGYDGYCRGVVPFHEVQDGISGTWASVESPKGGSRYANQKARLGKEDLRSSLDQACRLDQGSYGR
jgi:muramidase (phage lysozyme)